MERKTERERDGGERGWGGEKDKRDYSLSETEIYSIKCCQCNTFPSTVAKRKILPEMKAKEMKSDSTQYCWDQFNRLHLGNHNVFHFIWLNHRLKRRCSPAFEEPCDHILLTMFFWNIIGPTDTLHVEYTFFIWHYLSIMDENPKLDLFTLSWSDPHEDTHQSPPSELCLTCQLTPNTLTSLQRANVVQLMYSSHYIKFSSNNIALMPLYLWLLIS